MGIGPTRAEVVADLISVIQADYTKAVVKKQSNCPDCSGSGLIIADTDEETDSVQPCRHCKGSGVIEVDEFDFAEIPDQLKSCVQGFKVGPKGRILPDFRSKDKAATELIKAISNGWCSTFARDAYGNDAPAEQDEDQLTKDHLITAYQRIAVDADPATAMAAMREISKLKGWLTEDDNSVDNEPLTARDVADFFNQRLKSNGHARAVPVVTEQTEELPVDDDENAGDE